MIWLLLNTALAVDVDVIGIGPTSLETATAACLDGVALPHTGPRIPAFADVARAMLSRTEAEQVAYYRPSPPEAWPTDSVQVDTVPALPMTEPGVVAACAAVGQHWIQEGLRLQGACPDKKSCKAAIRADVWKMTYDLSLQTDNETFFIGLRKHDPPLNLWSDSLPFLDKACAGPQDASDHKLLVDANDLTAGRQACLQLLTLVEGETPGVIAKGCESPWADTTPDAARLIQVAGTTMSVGARVGPWHRNRLHTLVAAMDPSGVACTDWGDLHRGSVMGRWRAEQSKAACGDESLGLSDRVSLCPQFRGKEQGRCVMGEADGCMRAAKMTLEGIGTEPMLRPAVALYNKACVLGDADGCAQVTGHEAHIGTWFAEALAGAVPLPPVAPEPPVVEEEPGAEGAAELPDEDPGEPAPAMPDGAQAAMDSAVAIIDDYGPQLQASWTVSRRGELLATYLAAWMTSEATALLEATPDLDASVTEAALARIEAIAERRVEIAEAEAAAQQLLDEAEAAEAEAETTSP